ncbi:TetR/AcrR family transcriptional regulator [Actinomadura sp. WMMA1423]|uniref:TetR/AcrR family transcriptional regulator n=1 Tax=Actinomadura sp. WMMA1423 TaxID=2591108 RepID=UPI00143DB81F|nr:TetR/AcrR family transcriptional regulator [Actinomadura sp. WMMA1423]
MDDVAARDRVFEAGTRLFAALGYDETNLRLIADAAGVPAARITDLVGSKRELYVDIMQRAYEDEYATLREAVDTTGSARVALHQILDAYIDYHVSHPLIHAVWMHRWEADALDLPDLEDRYQRPLLRMCTRRIRDAVPPDVDPYFVLSPMVWCVYGFISSGVFARGHGRVDATDPAALAWFRSCMHLLMDRLTTPAAP